MITHEEELLAQHITDMLTEDDSYTEELLYRDHDTLKKLILAVILKEKEKR